ncbi:MAG: PDZ domain-containing protein, partial [Alphaproteobacteria bacterium]|nr:PDZ domain-containing protein [Alphaproteobacteria bacterium]
MKAARAPASLDAVGLRELERFNAAYDHAVNAPQNHRQRDHFRDAFRLVRANYVQSVEDAKLIDAALAGIDKVEAAPGAAEPRVVVEAALDSMLASLDPHSAYLNPDELNESRISTSGEFGGLGIEIVMEEGLVKVVSPIEDTPAHRAGIQAGDLLTHLDGDPIAGKSLSEAVSVMRGRPGTTIVLTVKRGTEDPFDVTIERAVIHVRSVRWRREGDIGYVRVMTFTEQVEPMLERAMADLLKEGEPPVKGVVLDLRNNPGGLLEMSLYVSDAFLEQGEIVSVRERDRGRD